MNETIKRRDQYLFQTLFVRLEDCKNFEEDHSNIVSTPSFSDKIIGEMGYVDTHSTSS